MLFLISIEEIPPGRIHRLGSVRLARLGEVV